MADITLQHSLVNGGVAVALKGVSVNYNWKNLFNVNPAVSKFDIVPGNYMGFENPTISIRGVMDMTDIDSNELNQSHLINFCTLLTTTPIVLTIPTSSSGSAEDPFPATPIYLKGRPLAGYQTNGQNTLLNSINIMIVNFSLDISNNSEMGHMWNYTIEARECY
jgi:hypothetical protein